MRNEARVLGGKDLVLDEAQRGEFGCDVSVDGARGGKLISLGFCRAWIPH